MGRYITTCECVSLFCLEVLFVAAKTVFATNSFFFGLRWEAHKQRSIFLKRSTITSLVHRFLVSLSLTIILYLSSFCFVIASGGVEYLSRRANVVVCHNVTTPTRRYTYNPMPRAVIGNYPLSISSRIIQTNEPINRVMRRVSLKPVYVPYLHCSFFLAVSPREKRTVTVIVSPVSCCIEPGFGP
jgi:hypothetical protein